MEKIQNKSTKRVESINAIIDKVNSNSDLQEVKSLLLNLNLKEKELLIISRLKELSMFIASFIIEKTNKEEIITNVIKNVVLKETEGIFEVWNEKVVEMWNLSSKSITLFNIEKFLKLNQNQIDLFLNKIENSDFNIEKKNNYKFLSYLLNTNISKEEKNKDLLEKFLIYSSNLNYYSFQNSQTVNFFLKWDYLTSKKLKKLYELSKNDSFISEQILKNENLLQNELTEIVSDYIETFLDTKIEFTNWWKNKTYFQTLFYLMWNINLTKDSIVKIINFIEKQGDDLFKTEDNLSKEEKELYSSDKFIEKTRIINNWLKELFRNKSFLEEHMELIQNIKSFNSFESLFNENIVLNENISQERYDSIVSKQDFEYLMNLIKNKDIIEENWLIFNNKDLF